MGENGTRAEDDETLTGLHRSGRLVSRYPEVRAMLADLAGPELDRAGRLLARLDPDEVLREHPDTPSLAIALTGHGTVAPLGPSLTAELARHGMLARVSVSDFDSWVFDLGDPGSALYAARPDLVCCLLDPMVVIDELPSPWRPDDVERIAMEKVALAERLAARFRSAGHGTLVLNTLPQPRWLTAQLVDLASRARIGVIWREANARLLRAAGDSVVVLDLDPLIGEGVPVRDARLSRYAKAHLSPALLAYRATPRPRLAGLSLVVGYDLAGFVFCLGMRRVAGLSLVVGYDLAGSVLRLGMRRVAGLSLVVGYDLAGSVLRLGMRRVAGLSSVVGHDQAGDVLRLRTRRLAARHGRGLRDSSHIAARRRAGVKTGGWCRPLTP